MILNFINIGVGLLIGLLTGFYFERRSTKAARAHARELQAELHSLRTSVYSIGGSLRDAEQVTQPVSSAEIADAILTHARATQDAEGRLRKSVLIAHFVAQGHATGDVTMALSRLSADGQLSSDERWVTLT